MRGHCQRLQRVEPRPVPPGAAATDPVLRGWRKAVPQALSVANSSFRSSLLLTGAACVFERSRCASTKAVLAPPTCRHCQRGKGHPLRLAGRADRIEAASFGRAIQLRLRQRHKTLFDLLRRLQVDCRQRLGARSSKLVATKGCNSRCITASKF